MAIELGWLDDEQEISILKVDVEGLEYDIFQGGLNLLESKRVKNISMGGSNGPANNITYLPYSENAHANFTAGLLFGCRGYEKGNCLQFNLWWKLGEEVGLVNRFRAMRT
jgi:hypothetical protein